MPYTDVHRLFLQVMMSHKILVEKEALRKYKQAHASLNDDTDEQNTLSIQNLKVFVNEINKKVSRFNLEIRVGTCEQSGKRYFILVNTVATALNLTLKKYTENELEVFKKIIDEVVGSENGRVSSITCMNISIPNMNKSAIESTIEKFVEDKWLDVILGKFSLSIRTITELGPLLKVMYKDDIEACELCKEIIFQGYRCVQCDTFIHIICLSKYSKHMISDDRELKCPNPRCDELVSTAPIRDDSDDCEPHRPNGNGMMKDESEPEQEPQKQKSVPLSFRDDSDDCEPHRPNRNGMMNDESEPEQEPTQKQKSVPLSSRSRSSRR